MIIKNAVIHTVTNGTIENGYIEFDEKIISLGDMKDCPQGEAYDAKGAALYPGFIDAHTHIGITEDSLTFEGEDCNEMTDPVTPNLRALDAVNALDRCFEEAREAGVTCVLTCPGSANPVAGQIAAIKTHGVCIDDMIVKAPAAMKFALGENPKTVYNEKKMAPSTRMATAAIIREQLTKTRVGLVVSDKMDKTVVVAIADRVAHPLYKKIVGRTSSFPSCLRQCTNAPRGCPQRCCA